MLDRACNEFRQRFPDGHVPNGDGHSRQCESCAAWAARRAGVAALLASCPRLAAPRRLDELASDALTPEHRLHRVVHELERLSAVGANESVEMGTESGAHARLAPLVLERLVAQDLEDLPRAVSRRLVQRLPKLKAPRALAARTPWLLATATAGTPASVWRGTTRLGVAAGLIAAAVLAWRGVDAQRAANDREPLRIVRATQADPLGPFARAWAEGIAGAAPKPRGL